MSNRSFLIALVLAWTTSPLSITASWEILDLPTDRGFTAIWAINEHTIFVTGHEGLWSTFDGKEWVLNSTYQPSSIYFADDTLGFLRGSILTIDGGKTWLKGDTINGNVGRINFPKGQSLIGYGLGYDYVSKTTDGGWHWSQLPPLPDVYPGFDETISPGDICFPDDPDTGYLTATCIKHLPEGEIEYHSSYFKTTDGGQTWVLNEEGLWNDDFGVGYIDFPQNATVGYMAGGGGKVFKTINGGATWDTVLKDRPYIVSMCFPENDQVGYVFGDSVAHKTTDGGKTWKQAVITHDSTFYECHFINNRVGFITGHKNMTLLSMPYDPGFVLKTTDGLIGIAEEHIDAEAPDLQVISSIGSQIVLRYSDYPQGFQASVFDAAGRKVDKLHSNLSSGTVTWGKGKPSGVYFIRPVGTTNSRSIRVVLVQ